MAQTVDGTLDSSYGFPKVWQTVQTGYGNNTSTAINVATGSELVAAYATISGDRLRVFLSGNLETSGNRVWLFVDSIAGGQNRLRGDNAAFSSLVRMGDSGGPNGVIFDTGFDPDFVFSINNTTSNVFLDFSSLPTSSGGTGVYIGQSTHGSGILSGGSNLLLQAECTINNSNTTGVSGGSTNGQVPNETQTGIELSVSASALGIVGGGPVKLFAYITSGDGSNMSNQMLPDVGANTAIGGSVSNFGEPRGINFNASPGTQYFFAHGLDNGRLAVARLNGTSGASTAIDIIEFNKTGTGQTPISTLSLPTAASPRITMSGSATSEGQLNRSTDGTLLSTQGYDTDTGVASIASSSVPRRVATITRTGALNFATEPQGISGASIRGSAIFGDGRVWVGGASGGLQVMSLGAATSTTVSSGVTNARFTNIANNRVQYSLNSSPNIGVFTFQTLVSTSTTHNFIVNSGTGTYDFVQVGPRRLYTCDDTSGTGGVRRYSHNGTSWVLDYTIVFGTTGAAGTRSITAEVDPATGNPVLYVTTADGSSNRVIRVRDTGTKAGAEATISVLATAGAGTIFRGIELSHLPLNTAPIATGESYSTNEDTPLSIAATGVLGNDTDDGQVSPLTAVLVAAMPAAEGTLTLNANGGFTFTPAANFSGTTSFTYKANDGALDSNTATVTISVGAVNDDPLLGAVGDQTVDELSPLSITLTSSDVDGGAPVYSMSGEPAGATLSGNTFSWTPTEAQGPGSYTVTFTVNDGNGGTDSETITITVNEVNGAPVLDAIGNQTIDELVAWTFDANATDSDDPVQTLTFSLVGAPAGMTIDGATGVISWTPTEAQGPGSYTFDVKVSDGTADDSETITVNVNEVNVSPVLDAIGNQTIDELVAWTFDANATDSDDPVQTLTFSLVGAPAGMTIDGATGVISWTPTEAQGPGSYTFDVKVSDGTADDSETITVNVNEVNAAPTADAQTLTTPEDTALGITLTGSDTDQPTQTLTYTVVDGPDCGTLSGTAPNLNYTPAANFAGTDTFTFKVNDGTVDSAIATVTINVTDVVDVSVNVIGSVAPNFFGSPSWNGYAARAMNSLENTPGVDDGNRATDPTAYDAVTTIPWYDNTATGTPFWMGVQDPLAPFNLELGHRVHFGMAVHGNGTRFSLSQLDFEWTNSDDPLFGFTDSWSAADVYSPNRKGIDYGPDRKKGTTDDIIYVNGETAALQVDELYYIGYGNAYDATVAPGATVAEKLAATRCYLEQNAPIVMTGTYKFRDGLGGHFAQGTGTVTIVPTNTLPVAASQTVSTDEDTPVNITLGATDTDPFEIPLTYTVVAGPTNGTLSGTAPNLIYTPDPGTFGVDTFTFKATDCVGDSNIATVTINVANVNDAPVLGAVGDQTVDELSPLSITLTSSDVDGGAPVYSMSGEPAGATLSGNTFSWTPTEAQGPGSYTVTFTVNDGNGGTDSETITITVNEVNSDPVLAAIGDQTVDELVNLSLTLSGSDSDDPAQTLTYSATGLPAGATLTGNAFSWTPTEAQGPGTYTVTFQVSDGTATDTETITITVNEVNSDPVLAAVGNQTIDELVAWTLDANATDSDNPAQTLTFSLTGAPAGMTIDGATGVISWTPTEAQGPGSYTFDVKVSDGTADDSETITVNVNEVNAAPTADAQTLTTPEDTALGITLTGSDTDQPAQTLTYTVVGSPAFGTLSGTAPNLNYTPNANFNGTDSFTFKVNDGTVDSALATITIGVTPVADMQMEAVGAPAPNAFGSPSWPGWRSNALTGMEGGVVNVGDRTTDPTAFEIVTSIPWRDAVVSGFPSWRGTANPLAPFASELGNRLHFPVVVKGNGTRFSLSQLDFALTSSDPGNDLGFVDSFDATDVYGASRKGIDYGPNRVKGGGDDIIYMAGQPATLQIDELVYAGVGNAWDASFEPGTNQEKLNSVRCYLEPLAPINISMTYKIRDGLGGFLVEDTAVVVLVPTNTLPVADAQTVSTNEDTPVNITLTASDVDNEPLTYTVVAGPTNGTLSGTAPNLIYTPDPGTFGVDTFTFKATDCVGDSNIATVTINVANVNDAPVLGAVGDQTVDELSPLSLTLTSSDVDGGAPVYSMSGEPAGATLSGNTFSWTPTEAQGPGSYTVTFTVNDGNGGTDSETITITVNEVNSDPVLAAIGDQTVDELVNLPLTLSGSDSDDPAQTLTYSATGLPAGATLTGNAFSWTPTEAQGPGTYTVTFQVSDGTATDTETITITVNEVNGAPVLDAIGNQTIDELVAWTLDANATDSDDPAQTLTFSLTGAPAGMTIDGATGVISWTPTEAQGPGSYTFDVKVSDGTADDSETITVTVNEVNVAPVLDPIGNISATTPTTITFDANATDADLPVQTLSYSLTGAPSGASIDSVTGVFTWTPTNAQSPGTYTFTVKVSDGTLEDSEVITITLTRGTTVVSGLIVLEDFTRSPFGEQVEFELRQGGNVIERRFVTLDAAGNYSFSTTQVGTFDISARGRTWISSLVTTVDLTPPTVSGLNYSLRNGDINGDNEVGPADFALLTFSFGSFLGDPNYSFNADLNGDFEVGPADFSILANNFGEIGD